MKYGEFKKELERVYNSKFKDSQCVVTCSGNLYNSIWIDLFLSKNQSECICNIRSNDMFHCVFNVKTVKGEFTEKITDNTELDNADLVLENVYNFYMINPTIQYMAYGSKKINYRKTTGNTDKILKAFERFVDKLYDSVCESLENGEIHNNYIDIVKSKI